MAKVVMFGKSLGPQWSRTPKLVIEVCICYTVVIWALMDTGQLTFVEETILY